MADLKPKHEAVLRKAAAVVRARGHGGDAQLADSINGIIASLTQPTRAAPVAQLDADLPPPDVCEHSAFSEPNAYSRATVEKIAGQYVECIRHLEREHGLLSMVVESLKARLVSADALIESMATKADRSALQPAQSIGDDETFIALARHWAAVREMYEDDEHKSVVAAWAGLIERIDGRTAGTASEAAPDAWVYECRQPLTDPVVWAEFFGRDKPSASTWVRNVRPLAYIGQHAAAKPLCPHCGTHEVELSRTCHNSACTGYATPETIYEGWRAAAPSTQPQTNEVRNG